MFSDANISLLVSLTKGLYSAAHQVLCLVVTMPTGGEQMSVASSTSAYSLNPHPFTGQTMEPPSSSSTWSLLPLEPPIAVIKEKKKRESCLAWQHYEMKGLPSVSFFNVMCRCSYWDLIGSLIKHSLISWLQTSTVGLVCSHSWNCTKHTLVPNFWSMPTCTFQLDILGENLLNELLLIGALICYPLQSIFAWLIRALIQSISACFHVVECRLMSSHSPPTLPCLSSLMAQGHMDSDASTALKTRPRVEHTEILNTTFCNNLESYLDWMFTESSNVGFGGSRNSIAGYAFQIRLLSRI